MKNINKLIFALCLLVPAMHAMQHGPNFELLGTDIVLPQPHNGAHPVPFTSFYVGVLTILSQEYDAIFDIDVRRDFYHGMLSMLGGLVGRLPEVLQPGRINSRDAARGIVTDLTNWCNNGFNQTTKQQYVRNFAQQMIDLAPFVEAIEIATYKIQFVKMVNRITDPVLCTQLRNDMANILGELPVAQPIIHAQHHAVHALHFDNV